MITFNRLTAYFFQFFAGINLGWGLLPTSNPWFTRVITVIYPWYNRDLHPKPRFGAVSVQNRDFPQPVIYPWYNHDLPVITHVLKHGFEPPNCADIFHTSLWHFILKKGMDARISRTIKIGQSRRKSRTYRPTTSTYLVDLLEQQPATICSEKGKTKTRVYPSRLEISRFWKGRVHTVFDISIYSNTYIATCK